MRGADVRKRFVEYFAERDHAVVKSSPLVPIDDPTLLFTNAGMVQFKDVFTGGRERAHPRACTVQKCMRAGGKHNDLENVGPSGRHLTFFEMLGNFSFGDYFKKEAIAHGWELLTRGLGLPADRLWASVYEKDDEAEELWRAHLPGERVVRLSEEDNFWAMGETGPCGPCSEIHFDRGPEWGPAGAPGDEGDRYLEVWNLVFMQYDRDADGTMRPLPRPSIDTGAGLERLAMVLQNRPTLFETDLFAPLIARAAKVTDDPISQRVIADHARAAAFLIAEGVFPEKTGRSYVLRRIMRRAIRHGAASSVFFHDACLAVVDTYRDVYPELEEARSTIAEIVRLEEERFRETLDRGLRLIAEWRERREPVMPGEVLFKLYDTYGFPTDLVEVIGREQGFAVDQQGFDQQMAQQRERSAFGGAQVTDAIEVDVSRIADPSGCTFVGHARLQDEAHIKYVSRRGSEISFVASATPFYAESGGQVGDTGLAEGDGFRLDIVDTQRSREGLTVHLARLAEGRPPETGDRVVLRVDAERRTDIMRNHSGTHLLHHALRHVLGSHVMQKGSLVGPDRLRFDFSHFRPVADEEVRAIQDMVAERVLDDAETETYEKSFDEARKMGALAFFGDKYGDRVRVVRIGRDSIELCGGTHVSRAGEVGLLKVSAEGGIAQGVRRVEAVTGKGLLQWAERAEKELQAAAKELRSAPFEVAARVEKLQRDLREREREIEALRRKMAAPTADLLESARDVNGMKVLCTRVEVSDPRALREIGDRLRDRLGSGVLVLAGTDQGKLALLVMVSKDLTGRVEAGKLMREIAPVLGARGGGKAELAQAGGGDPSRLDDAFRRVYEIVG